MYDFTYHKPDNLDEASQLLSGDDAKIVAGGMTLIPTLKQRLAQHSDLVDLSGVTELQSGLLRPMVLFVLAQ